MASELEPQPQNCPEIDANGVDRAQIRQSLALPPEERLQRSQEFAEGILEIWKLNGTRPLR